MTQNERISLPIWKRIITATITLFVFTVQVMLFIFAFQITYSNELNKIVYVLIQTLGIVLVVAVLITKVVVPNTSAWLHPV